LKPLAPIDKSLLKETGTELLFLLIYIENEKITRCSIYCKDSTEIFAVFSQRIKEYFIGSKFSIKTPSTIFLPVVFSNPFSKKYHNDELKTAYNLSKIVYDNSTMIIWSMPPLFLMGGTGERQSLDNNAEW
jgi:hypothetical protein